MRLYLVLSATEVVTREMFEVALEYQPLADEMRMGLTE